MVEDFDLYRMLDDLEELFALRARATGGLRFACERTAAVNDERKTKKELIAELEAQRRDIDTLRGELEALRRRRKVTAPRPLTRMARR